VKYRRVLIADSHQNMLGGVYGLLDTLFDSVLMVADETSLFDAIVTMKPDLVILDLSLPNEGEASIAKSLLESHPEVRILLLSVHDESTIVSHLLELGIAGFVLKRSVATDLVPAVTEVLRGRVYVSPALRANLLGTAPQGLNEVKDIPAAE
jgi:DNA-binding NarL/FixJ family response regulator